MKITDTISVNPSKTAVGHIEMPADSIFRQNVLTSSEETSSLNLAKVIFPTRKAAFGDYAKYSIALRTLFATILIVSGLSMLSAPVVANTGMAICSLCFGGILALGLITRPLMIGAAAFYCIMGALSIRTGVADPSTFSLMFGCLIFAVLGAGKYSCDDLIRSAIRRNSQKKAHSKSDNDPGYKAFHKVRY